MEIAFLICDATVAFFNLLFHTRLTLYKKCDTLHRAIKYTGSALIFVLFMVAVYAFDMPSALASLICLSLPSFILFFSLSKNKDTRFIVIFLLVDSVAFIIAYVARLIASLGGEYGHIIGAVISVCVIVVIYIVSASYFKVYRDFLEHSEGGWVASVVASIINYFALIFLAQYPTSVIKQRELVISYAVYCITVLAYYSVFITNVISKKRLYEANTKLAEEQEWHNTAYVDSLTGIKNRMAYMERISALERSLEPDSALFAIMVDIDSFKHINDHRGHHVGDAYLREVAKYLRSTFPRPDYKLFRVGGDEFAIIGIDVDEDSVSQRVEAANTASIGYAGISVSAGYVAVDPADNNAIETAFIRADEKMYERKRAKRK